MKEKFDFNDILIVPDYYTTINSRYKDIILNGLPLITAPMDTVVDLSNIDLFIKHNIFVALPRTVNYANYLAHVENSEHLLSYYENVFVGIGMNEVKDIISGSHYIAQNENILIDVANGHMMELYRLCEQLGHVRPDIKLMVGNIANPQTYTLYAKLENVKFIRCGIGNGNGCLTTKSTSVGYPMASLISEIKVLKDELENENKHTPAIIADGGMKDTSDIIKALYLGADMVMVGSIFNKALESCGDNYFHGVKINLTSAKFLYKRGFKVKKHFRGMSTKSAQKAMGKTTLKTSEGVVRYREVEYTLKGWFENFEHYLRTAMSYCNCYDLNEFIGENRYVFITQNAYNRFNK